LVDGDQVVVGMPVLCVVMSAEAASAGWQPIQPDCGPATHADPQAPPGSLPVLSTGGSNE